LLLRGSNVLLFTTSPLALLLGYVMDVCTSSVVYTYIYMRLKVAALLFMLIVDDDINF
jgi:hypothetical protein